MSIFHALLLTTLVHAIEPRQRIENQLTELSQSLVWELEPGITTIVRQVHGPLAARLEGPWTTLDDIFSLIHTHLNSYLEILRTHPVDTSLWARMWKDPPVPDRVATIITQLPARSNILFPPVYDTFLNILPSLQQSMSLHFHHSLTVGQQENFMIVWSVILKMIQHCTHPDTPLLTITDDMVVDVLYQAFQSHTPREVSTHTWPTHRRDRNERIRMAVNGIIHHLLSLNNLSQIQANVEARGQEHRERCIHYTLPPFHTIQILMGLVLTILGLFHHESYRKKQLRTQLDTDVSTSDTHE